MKTLKPTSINVRVDDELKARVKALARVQGVTISELARSWFEECVELQEDLLAKELEDFKQFED